VEQLKGSQLLSDRFTATRLREGAIRSAGGVITNSSADHVVALAGGSAVTPPTYSTGARKPLIID
jgi:hypothetical protein